MANIYVDNGGTVHPGGQPSEIITTNVFTGAIAEKMIISGDCVYFNNQLDNGNSSWIRLSAFEPDPDDPDKKILAQLDIYHGRELPEDLDDENVWERPFEEPVSFARHQDILKVLDVISPEETSHHKWPKKLLATMGGTVVVGLLGIKIVNRRKNTKD